METQEKFRTQILGWLQDSSAPTIGSWWSQWVVRPAHHCFLLWRWWSDTLWVTLIRFTTVHALLCYLQKVVVEIPLQSHKSLIIWSCLVCAAAVGSCSWRPIRVSQCRSTVSRNRCPWAVQGWGSPLGYQWRHIHSCLNLPKCCAVEHHLAVLSTNFWTWAWKGQHFSRNSVFVHFFVLTEDRLFTSQNYDHGHRSWDFTATAVICLLVSKGPCHIFWELWSDITDHYLVWL